MNNIASDNQEPLAPAGEPLRLPEHASCRKCGYQLRGLTDPRCPECGRAFNPNWPYSYYDPVRQAALWEARARLVSWSYVAATALLTLFVLYQASIPQDLVGTARLLCLAAPGVLLLSAADCAMCAVARRIRQKFGLAMAPHRGTLLRRWLAPVLAAAVIAWAFHSTIPTQLRFAASRGAFERAARDVLAGKTLSTPRRVGLYHVNYIENSPNGYILFQTGTNWVDPAGFGYLVPGGGGMPRGRLLAPGWYMQDF